MRERSEIARLVKYSFSKWGRYRPPVARAHDHRLGTECQQSGGSADRSRTPANSELAKFGSARRDDRRGRDDHIRAGWRRRERLESRPASAHRRTAEFRLVRDDGRSSRRAGPGRNRAAANQGCASPQTKMAQGARTSRHRRRISKRCSQAIRSMSQQISPIGPTGNHFWSTLGRRRRLAGGAGTRIRPRSGRVGWRTAALASRCALPRKSQPRPRRSSASRPLRRPSQHGLVCMLQKQLLSLMLHVVPRQKCRSRIWVGEEFAMGNTTAEGRLDARTRRRNAGIDRDQGRNLCERNQTITHGFRPRRPTFRKGIRY